MYKIWSYEKSKGRLYSSLVNMVLWIHSIDNKSKRISFINDRSIKLQQKCQTWRYNSSPLMGQYNCPSLLGQYNSSSHLAVQLSLSHLGRYNPSPHLAVQFF